MNLTVFMIFEFIGLTLTKNQGGKPPGIVLFIWIYENLFPL